MPTEIKFRLAGGVQPLILLPAWVNGEGPFEFILDTGAGVSLLAPGLAQRLGVAVTGTKEGMSAAGKVTVSLGTVERLSVGDTAREQVEVGMTQELRRIGAAIGAKVDGVLGYNFLRHYRLTIDYRRTALRLRAAGLWVDETTAPPRGRVRFRLAHPSKPLILVSVHVNGEGPYQFALDTGASTTVVSPELAQRRGVSSAGAETITGGGGTTPASVGSLHSLAVGPAVQRDLAVMVAPFLGPLGQAVSASLDGIIGYNYLKAFRVSIDYPNETLDLE